MSTIDFSKEIYGQFFGRLKNVVVITLRDNTTHAGKLTGFFRGEKEFNEPYIIRWRFVDEKELKEVDFLPYPNQEAGIIIRQEDIMAVRFKSD